MRLLCATLLANLIVIQVHASEKLIDGIAAIVNNEAVTCYQIEQDTHDLIQQLRAIGQPKMPPIDELHQRSLEARIMQVLQVQEASNLELEVGDDEIERAIAEVEARNGIPSGQLISILKTQGVDPLRYRDNLKEQLLIAQLINVAVRAKLKISEESMREYFRKYLENPQATRSIELSQIFHTLPTDPTPEEIRKVREELEQLRQRAINGEDFHQLAALHSEGPEAAKGGKMGWFKRGELPNRFETLLDMPIGAISKPIRSPAGFHMLYVANDRIIEAQKTGESYDEAHARHILIKLPSTVDAKTEAKIRKRVERLARELDDADDEEFATRAKEASQGPSAAGGGDLGWFRRGAMLPAFEKAVFNMQAGEVSGVVETPFGLHVIRLSERRRIDPNSFEAHRANIRNALLSIEIQEQLPRWLAGLKSRAHIENKGCDASL
ncbi:MAG: peptidylprolyl isomerase [Mariprofundaceae bacterium]